MNDKANIINEKNTSCYYYKCADLNSMNTPGSFFFNLMFNMHGVDFPEHA